MSPASFATVDQSNTSWCKPGAEWPALSAGEIHLWRLDLNPPAAALATLEAWLSSDERERAARFGKPALRRRYRAGRGALRQILAGYLDLGPAELRFAYGPQGKPRLEWPAPLPERALCFNLAHCEDRALLAVAMGRDVGVDLEHLRRLPKARALAARYFTPEEQAELERRASTKPRGVASDAVDRSSEGRASEANAQLDSDATADDTVPPLSPYEAAFFQLWCCKEAFLKATGEALSRPLGSFEVKLGGLDPAGHGPGSSAGAPDWADRNRHPRLSQLDGGEARAEAWSIRVIEGFEGHVAALVTPGRPLAISRWRFES